MSHYNLILGLWFNLNKNVGKYSEVWWWRNSFKYNVEGGQISGSAS